MLTFSNVLTTLENAESISRKPVLDSLRRVDYDCLIEMHDIANRKRLASATYQPRKLHEEPTR